MNQQVFFENIRSQIIKNLRECKSDLKIAVAWFTDEKIINEVNELINKNVDVEIIIYDNHVNRKDLFEKLYYNKAKIFLSRKLMHNKFCIIDSKTVINGSYNWTYNASTNEENIQITYNNYEFSEKFINQFKKIKRACNTIDSFFEYSLDNINSIIKDFEYAYSSLKQTKFPYFYNLSDLKKSEKNKSVDIINNGYYLIKNGLEEKELFRAKYFVESKYALIKVYQILSIKSTLPLFFSNIPELENKYKKIHILNQTIYRVENWNTKELFFIDDTGNKTGETYNYTNKLRKGLYFDKSSETIIDINLKKFPLEMENVNFIEEIGFLGKSLKKRFSVEKTTNEYNGESKYDEKSKYGLKGFNNSIIVDFEFDDYKYDPSNNELILIELPILRIFKNVVGNVEVGPVWNSINVPKKFFKFNSKEEKLEIQKTQIDRKNYIFLSDNEKLREFHLALRHNTHVGLFRNVLREKNYYEIKERYLRGFNFYKNGYDIWDFVEKEHENYRDYLSRLNKTGKYKEGCYIATMVYGNYNHPNVLELRRFRDKTLKKNLLGRIFIGLYYKYSPNYVDYVRNKRLLNLFSTVIIKGIVIGIKTWHNN
jgi:hypothetical protein